MAGGPRIALLDYGMGNLRSIEKALERVGALPERTHDAEIVRACDGVILPGVGAFPRAMEAVRARGLDTLLAERLADGVPVLGICLGMQLLYERSTELGGAEGLGVLAGEVRPLDAPGLKIPQIGWNAVNWRRPSAITAALPKPCAFYHVHSLSVLPGDDDTIVGTATYGSEFASVVAHGKRLWRPVPPREVGSGRARPAGGVRRSLRAGSRAPRRGPERRARPLILFPAVDIRGGRAVRLHLGHFDAETVYADSPLEAARGWVEAGARHLHVVDLDGARAGAPEHLDQLRAMAGELDVPIQYGGGLRTLESVRDALGAGATRVVLGTAALRDERLLDAALAEAGPERVVVAVDARGEGCRWRAGPRPARSSRRSSSRGSSSGE